MELTHEFRVNVPVDAAWSLLTDVERIAPCLPGAALEEVAGDDYLGQVKVKVGPITASYQGKATFVARDDAAHQAVLRAEGRESRGQGTATATITATLAPDGDGTSVRLVTNLNVTGRVAQLGRGVLSEVSARLLDRFVECLEHDLLEAQPAAAAAVEAPPDGGAPPARVAGDGATEAAPAGGPTQPVAPVARPVPRQEAESIDLLEAAGVPFAKRFVPVVAAAVVLAWGWRRRRRRRRWRWPRTGAPGRRAAPGSGSPPCSGARPRARSRWSCATRPEARWSSATLRCSTTAPLCPPGTGWWGQPSGRR
jgi:carbon monoxide dehydrogenase subunit G